MVKYTDWAMKWQVKGSGKTEPNGLEKELILKCLNLAEIRAHSKKDFLDVGCMDGYTKEFIEELEVNWWGTDPLSVVNWVFRSEASDLLFRDNSMDVVFCGHTLEHTLSPMLTLIEFNRVLRTGGILLIILPGFTHGFTAECKEHILNPHDWQMENMLKKSGFATIEHIDEEPSNRIWICRKVKGLKSDE